jgi:hypothetical protein
MKPLLMLYLFVGVASAQKIVQRVDNFGNPKLYRLYESHEARAAWDTTPYPFNETNALKVVVGGGKISSPDSHYGLMTQPQPRKWNDPREYFVLAAIHYWDEYAKECWNDSTVIDRGFWFAYGGSGEDDRLITPQEAQKLGKAAYWRPYSDLGELIESVNHVKPVIKYGHHKHPSFPGFIKFLKRKEG